MVTLLLHLFQSLKDNKVQVKKKNPEGARKMESGIKMMEGLAEGLDKC